MGLLPVPAETVYPPLAGRRSQVTGTCPNSLLAEWISALYRLRVAYKDASFEPLTSGPRREKVLWSRIPRMCPRRKEALHGFQWSIVGGVRWLGRGGIAPSVLCKTVLFTDGIL